MIPWMLWETCCISSLYHMEKFLWDWREGSLWKFTGALDFPEWPLCLHSSITTHSSSVLITHQTLCSRFILWTICREYVWKSRASCSCVGRSVCCTLQVNSPPSHNVVVSFFMTSTKCRYSDTRAVFIVLLLCWLDPATWFACWSLSS